MHWCIKHSHVSRAACAPGRAAVHLAHASHSHKPLQVLRPHPAAGHDGDAPLRLLHQGREGGAALCGQTRQCVGMQAALLAAAPDDTAPLLLQLRGLRSLANRRSSQVPTA